MKINLNELRKDKINNTSENVVKMRLSENASSMVFQLFTKNVYSNPIGTVVREITSNCFDSHVEADVDSPVLIKKTKDSEDNYHISFIDYGVGMSPDRVHNIYGVYFESTKSTDNEQIGGFGVGAKSVLAYKRSTGQGEGEYDNSFFVITRYDGIEYSYMIYEGSESPVISELHQEKTTERNGTEIRIPVLQKDIPIFTKEMKRQLYYFENVVFDGFEKLDYNDEVEKDSDGNVINEITNDYQIIRGKNFLFRGSEYSQDMHICLGRVAYPIDYNVLDLSSTDYRLPIALKLEVGDINVNVSREAVDYSEKTIKFLKKKLELTKAEIIELIENQYSDIKTLEQYFAVKNDFGKLQFKNGASLYVGNLIEQKDVDFSNFKYSFMKMPNDKQLFRFFFKTKMYGKKPKTSRYSSNSEFDGGYSALLEKNNLLHSNGEFERKIVKQAWLEQKHTTYYIIQRRELNREFIKSEIADLFNVHLDTLETATGRPVASMKSLIEMQVEYMNIVAKNTQNYKTLEVPEDFVASRKRGAGITSELRKKTIPVKFMGGYSKDRVKLSVLFDAKMPIFYGNQEDEHALRNAKRIFDLLFNPNYVVAHCDYNDKLLTRNECSYNPDKDCKGQIAFVMVANNNIKHFAHCKKAYHISEFKWRMAYRKEDEVRQYFQMREAIEKYEELDNFYSNGFINLVNQSWGTKVDKIKNYIDNIPETAKEGNIYNYKSTLSSYMNLDNIKPTAEQKSIIDKIEGILDVQKNNEKTLKYFNIPYNAEEIDDELLTLLQLAMTL